MHACLYLLKSLFHELWSQLFAAYFRGQLACVVGLAIELLVISYLILIFYDRLKFQKGLSFIHQGLVAGLVF